MTTKIGGRALGRIWRNRMRASRAPDARAALDNYLHLCPAAQSVIDCIQITHELKLEEMAASPRGT
jgi:hypothetical protein